MAERVIGMLVACVLVLGMVSCDTSGARRAQGALDDGPELFPVS